MLRKLYIIFFSLGVTANLIFAANTPVSAKNLKDVADEVKIYDKKNYPLLAPDALDVSSSDLGYTTKASGSAKQAEEELTTNAYAAFVNCHAEPIREDLLKPKSFFARILDFFKDLFGIGVVDTGNLCAQDYLSGQLPPEVGKQMLVRARSSLYLAQSNNSDVLGTAVAVSDNAMRDAFDCSKCAGLPLALCSCGDFGGTDPNQPPDNGGTPVPPGEIPEACLGTATCYDGNRQDCYQDTSLSSSCWIIKKGWCSEECLSAFFKGDKDAAKKASMICWRESVGNAQIPNKSCLKSTDGIDNDDNEAARCVDLEDSPANGCGEPYYDGASVDYSIGLFQINLLAHCPASGPTYTWDPPTCSFANIGERDKCENDMKDGVKNILKAVEESNNGLRWHPWAASRAAYCDIEKYDK